MNRHSKTWSGSYLPVKIMPSKLARLFAVEWSTVIQYRFDLLLWTGVEAATPLISLAVWYAVARSTPSFVLSPRDTLTYYVLVMFVLVCTNAWNGYFFAREILNGDLVKYLVRPMGALWHHVVNNLVEKGIKFIIPVPLLLVSMWIWREAFSPAIFEPRHLLLFIPSLLLALGVSFLLDMALGTLAFWFEDANEIRRYKDVFQEVASGVLIPFAAMPEKLQFVLGLLPFRYTLSAPLEVLLGQVEGTRALALLGQQAAWMAVLGFVLWVLYRAGLKRYAVPGQ